MRSCGFSSKCKASAQISLEGSRTRSAPSVSRSAAWNSRLRCVDFSARVAGAASFDALVSAFQIFWSMLVRSPSPGVSASKSAITSSINACHRSIGESPQPPQAYSNSYHPSWTLLCDTAVDPRRNVELCRVYHALDQLRRWPYQIPDRQGGNGDSHNTNDDG